MERPPVVCTICEKEVDEEIEKHNWKCHPKNKYEELWAKHAKENFKNWKGSTYFESDPYY